MMTADDLFVALAGMTPEQRQGRTAVVKVRDDHRPNRMHSVIASGVHRDTFWIEIKVEQ